MRKRKQEATAEATAETAAEEAAEAAAEAARPKRQIKQKPAYVMERMVFSQRIPKNKPQKPQKPKDGAEKPAFPRRNNQYTVGRNLGEASYGRGGGGGGRGAGRGGGGRGRVRGGAGAGAGAGSQPDASEPLLRGSKAAEEWGWKNKLPDGRPLCPLYYGCPEPSEYFCCERHRLLWQGGTLLMTRMPEEWKRSAPDPEWVLNSKRGASTRSEDGSSEATSARGSAVAQSQPAARRGTKALASWVREGHGEGEEEGEEEGDEGEEGSEEEGEDEEGEEGEEGDDGEEGEEAEQEDEDDEDHGAVVSAEEAGEEGGEEDEEDEDHEDEEDEDDAVVEEEDEDEEDEEEAMDAKLGTMDSKLGTMNASAFEASETLIVHVCDEESELKANGVSPVASGPASGPGSGPASEIHAEIHASGPGSGPASLTRGGSGIGFLSDGMEDGVNVNATEPMAVEASGFGSAPVAILGRSAPAATPRAAPAPSAEQRAAAAAGAVAAAAAAASGAAEAASSPLLPRAPAANGAAAAAATASATHAPSAAAIWTAAPGTAPGSSAVTSATVTVATGSAPTDAMPPGTQPACISACISASSEPPTDAMPAPLPGADPNALETARVALVKDLPNLVEPEPHVRAQKLLMERADCLLCRSAATLARVAAHSHAPPFSAPVDLDVFPDYLSRVQRPMDLRAQLIASDCL